MQIPSLLSILGVFVFLVFPHLLQAQAAGAASSSAAQQWVSYTGSNGVTVYLNNDREPALYTQDFGDCQGDSAVNVTRFDAAYYKDNMTVLFHLEGTTAIANASVISGQTPSSSHVPCS